MGRSKFPGKPSKHVNRQRVNVLACSTNRETNKTVVIAENIFIGLSTNNTSSLEVDAKSTNKGDAKSENSNEKAHASEQTNTNRNTQKPTSAAAKLILKNRRRLSASTLRENTPCAIRRSQIRNSSLPRSEFIKNSRRQRTSDTINLGGKFILPQRSVHSSRVIKPNKRFVESDSGGKSAKTPPSENVRSSRSSDGEKRRGDASKVPDEPDAKHMSASSSKIVPDIVCDEKTLGGDVTHSPVPTNRLILRKAKLQLHQHNSTSNHDGPFSNSMLSADQNNGLISPGTVTCGVCGAVRFYRFVKQARKFNIYSCESCRKFISKMIKRQAGHKTGSLSKLVCHKGQGICHVPPIVRSQQWNLIRCAYKARCPACWLKMCLRSFKMPPKLKANLAEMLPTNMQPIETLALDTTMVTSIAWKKLVVSPKPIKSGVNAPEFSFANTTLFKPADYQNGTNIQNRSKRATTHLRVRKKVIPSTPIAHFPQDKSIRQKLDLKGPRVKHVCRSASIVLGQSPATFQHKETNEPTPQDPVVERITDSTHNCDDCHHSSDKNVDSEVSIVGNDNEFEVKNQMVALNDAYSTFKTRPKIQQVCSEPVYDALEVRQHGFGLVMSRGVVPREVCFLCGSAGQEELIHCAVCCEPYHDYCVGADAAAASIGVWACTRCSVMCAGCVQPAVRTTPCMLCRQLFHTSCLGFGTALCISCLQCLSCGSAAVDKIVGTSAYCLSCFLTKYKNHHCPLCKESFEVNHSKEVICCSRCNGVWHVTCDNISDEQLLMLRTLSLCEKYTCHKCYESVAVSKYSWREKVGAHFVVGCLAVLRALAELRVSQKQPARHIVLPPECSEKDVPAITTPPLPNDAPPPETGFSDAQSKYKLAYKVNKLMFPSINEKDSEVNSLVRNFNQFSDNKHEFGPCRDDLKSGENASAVNKPESVPTYLKQKFFLRDCSVAIKNLGIPPESNVKVNKSSDICLKSTEKNDSALCDNDCELVISKKCTCTETLTLLEVKRKVVAKDYVSLSEFRHDLDLAIRGSGWNEVLDLLDDIFCKEFPWCAISTRSTYSPSCPELKSVDCEVAAPLASESLVARQRPLAEEVEEVYDSRNCVLCLCHGDKADAEGGRLLYCESNTCIHVACALWSVGVHETLDGALLGVAATVRRARLARCVACKLRGATIDCSHLDCKASYHFPCARKAGCQFIKNYRVFCVEHAAVASKNQELSDENFKIRRSVYVHMDLKKQIISAAHSKWQFVVGSLIIRNLGSYFPNLCDFDDVIIPSGMTCMKLFWSSVEPWRVIKYNITTIVSTGEEDIYSGDEDNVCVDHSESPDIVSEKLSYIKKVYINADNLCESDIEEEQIMKVSREVVNYLLDTVSSVDDCEELPQNATDILPPEIKDAIFEDLPHDVLDGISMQDIFPKLMSYDDILNMNETCMRSDSMKDHCDEISPTTELPLINKCYRKRPENENSFWNYSRSVDDSMPHMSVVVPSTVNRSLKRSKSDVLPYCSGSSIVSGNSATGNHKRSCSLTWSCKVNTGAIKKRKISCVTELESNVLMVVDDSFMMNQQAEKIPDMCMLRRRILQVDGANDSESDGEGPVDTETATWSYTPAYERYPFTDGIDGADEPVRCQRCQCTYRTPDSYARHLNACDTMSTSDSDTDTVGDGDKTLHATSNDYLLSSNNASATILNMANMEQNVYSNITITATTTSVLPPPLVTLQNKSDGRHQLNSNVQSLLPNGAEHNLQAATIMYTNKLQEVGYDAAHDPTNAAAAAAAASYGNLVQTPIYNEAPQIHKYIAAQQSIGQPSGVNPYNIPRAQAPNPMYITKPIETTYNSITKPTVDRINYKDILPQQNYTNVLIRPSTEMYLDTSRNTANDITYTNLLDQNTPKYTGFIQNNTGLRPVLDIGNSQYNNAAIIQNTTPSTPILETPHPFSSMSTSNINRLENITSVPNNVYSSNTPNPKFIIRSAAELQHDIQNQSLNNTPYINIKPHQITYQNTTQPIQVTSTYNTVMGPPKTIQNDPNSCNATKKRIPNIAPAAIGHKKSRAKPVRRNFPQKQIRIESDQINVLQQIQPNLGQQNTLMVQQSPMFQSKQLFMHPMVTGGNDLSGFTTEIIKPNGIINSPNIQYILTPNINCNIVNNTQLITSTNQLAQNTFQIPQTMNFITDLSNNGDMVISPSISNPVVGTIIQSAPQLSTSAAFECGIMSTEQILFSPQVQTQPTIPCMYVGGLGTNQPVIYGLETVVQNTVMSQQFMSKVGLPGLLAQNSYHTATTQVFQTSTIEPVIPEMQPSNCMVIQQPQLIPQKHHCIEPTIIKELPTITPNPITNQMPPLIATRPQIVPIPIMRNTVENPPVIITPPTHQPSPHKLHVQQTPHNISLPVAPNQLNKLPTNVVPPTPQTKPLTPRPSPASVNPPKPTRPMNRVLPMTVRTPATKPVVPKESMAVIPRSVEKKPITQLISDHIEEKITLGMNTKPLNIQQKTVTILDVEPLEHLVEQKIKLPVIEDPVKDLSKFETLQSIPNEISVNVNHMSCSIPYSPKPDPPPAPPTPPLKYFPDHLTDEENVLKVPYNIESLPVEVPKIDEPKENNINLENASLKLVFQKQSEEGIYKISNKTAASRSPPKVSIPVEEKPPEPTPPKSPIQTPVEQELNTNLYISIIKEPTSKSSVDLCTSKKLLKKTRGLKSKSNTTTTTTTAPKTPKLLFKVQSQDGLSFTCSSLTELWQKVFDSVQESRKLHNMAPLPAEALNGYQALGLKNQSLKCIFEEMKKLRLAEKQRDGANEILGHGSLAGSARCTAYTGQRNDHDMFSWLASKHRQLEFPEGFDLETISRRASSINLPIAMRYRNLKETSKQCVGVYRSGIHGRGLFCLRDIELGEMVIEYAGEVIRSSMTDIREKYYNSKGIGCYMFRIDDNLVVDATVKGNAARFINHSCDPNCYSRVLEILGHKHILIFALRKIQQGEELTYDYKFPFEEDKIPCTCGARRCRKYLN